MKRILTIFLMLLLTIIIFPIISFAEGTPSIIASPTPKPTASPTLTPTPISTYSTVPSATKTSRVAGTLDWETGEPVFTIDFNTVKLNGTIAVESGAINNVITIVSDTQNKNRSITVDTFKKHWQLPDGTQSITFFNADDTVASGNTPLTTGMKASLVDQTGKKLAPYTFVVTGNITGGSKFALTDYVLLWNHLAKTSALTPLQIAAADLNQNGRVDIGDLAIMVNTILRG